MCEPAFNVELGIVPGSGGVVTALINEVMELNHLQPIFSVISYGLMHANTVLFLKGKRMTFN